MPSGNRNFQNCPIKRAGKPILKISIFGRKLLKISEKYQTEVVGPKLLNALYLITMSTITQLIGYISTDALPLSLNKLVLPENFYSDDRSAIFKKKTASVPLSTKCFGRF